MHTHSAHTALLSCSGISKTYDHLVLDGVQFSVHRGEKIGLVGPNGSGKSTLLRILAGIETPDAGSVTVESSTVAYFPQTHDAADLSGGERAKRVLEPLMRSPAALFLLDEPTNNLDTDGLERLEEFVSHHSSACIIISHDRAFLDRTVTKILELDPHTHTATIYNGTYTEYREAREQKIAREWSAYADAQEKLGRLTKETEQRLGWMREIEARRKRTKKLPKHEKEKPQAAILRDQEAEAGHRARIMKDRRDAFAEEAQAIHKPVHELPLKIELDAPRGSTNVFTLTDVTLTYDSRAIGPITATIQYGDRVHISGPNGAGKTTLINALLGTHSGGVQGMLVRGADVRIGYLPQSAYDTATDESALQHFLRETEIEETDARKLLNRYRITAEDVHKPLTVLSPGEHSRLLIAELVARNPNCLILDEPTNHLDLEVVSELEETLATFTGTLIVVSHDRYFIEKLGLTKEIRLG
ncbi:ATP-binding cassette domain-containing protein [Patescibacteria group bacterium]|nr:ATP-binding cassette domain-containing protein [Patescibacteria group bacterium]